MEYKNNAETLVPKCYPWILTKNAKHPERSGFNNDSTNRRGCTMLICERCQLFCSSVRQLHSNTSPIFDECCHFRWETLTYNSALFDSMYKRACFRQLIMKRAIPVALCALFLCSSMQPNADSKSQLFLWNQANWHQTRARCLCGQLLHMMKWA